MSIIFLDIETYHGFFFIGCKRLSDGKRVGVEFSSRTPQFDKAYVRNVLLKNTTVGYNSLGYDLPMIWYALQDGITNADLKRASDGIIKGGIKWWEVEDFLGIQIPWDVKRKHIDLIEPQPNAFASLKSLNGRMHGTQLQDLPLDPDLIPTPAQMDIIADYCMMSDLDATENLWNALAEPMELRVALGEIYAQDFRSKSDAQIGEAIVKKRYEDLTGFKPKKIETKPGTTFRYPVPEWVKFENPKLRGMVEQLRVTDFMVNKEGKAELPALLEGFTVKIGSTTYKMGIGGLHSKESHRAVFSNGESVLVDADVASQYPSIIMSLGLAPKSLGDNFLKIYADILSDRLKAKNRGKEIKSLLKIESDPAITMSLLKEQLQQSVRDKGGKVSLNGVYGKLGSKYSILHAPHLLISVTITGQLSILMMVESAEKAGIKVVSGNTDGLLFLCPRDKFAGIEKDRMNPCALSALTDEWERVTGYNFEFGEYKAIYNSSVNCYYAIKASGGHKRKGPIGNPWNLHPDDFDPVRGQLMKNPQMTICSDAALACIKEGTPVEQTIRACRDIRQFVTVIKAAKGASWRGDYLGKTVRYYWGIGGEPIIESEPHATTGNFKKIPKSDGAIECMRLPDEFPDDIDYAKYIEEAESILTDVGFYGDIIEPVKPIRLTKANRLPFAKAWLLCG